MVDAAYELPPDNAARIAIYDALAMARDEGHATITTDDLLARVTARLALLVPRELHLMGGRAYLEEKVSACAAAGTLERVEPTGEFVRLGSARPQIAYPDGSVRDYDAGLEAAKERLQGDDAKLLRGGFDVRHLVPSVADDPDSELFKALVKSIREWGYLEHSPILQASSGRVMDGRARQAAAAIAGVAVVQSQIPPRRDTPLHRALLVLDANCTRLSEADRQAVYQAIGEMARPWASVEADLERTRQWRLATPRKYVAQLDARKVRYRASDQPKIQVTKDRTRVMLRSLLEAAGLASYKYELLTPYVAFEAARTRYTAGRTANFVDVADAIAGIGTMQRDRRKRKLNLDPEWEAIRNWLIGFSRERTSGQEAAFGPRSAGRRSGG